MAGPTLKLFNKLEQIKCEINRLYNELDKATETLHEKYGEDAFYYEIEEDSDGHKFAKLEIVNNIRKLNEGESVFKATSFKPQELVVKRYKRKPKDMK